MVNKAYAKEWLTFAKKNLETARLLYNVNHYEDIIGIEIQQSLEKSLKALLAYKNTKIQKDHDLVKLYFLTDEFIYLEEKEIVFLKIATNYYKDDRYPNPNYTLPPKSEIEELLEFTEDFFSKVYNLVEFNKKI